MDAYTTRSATWRLLALPPELRLQVYEIVMADRFALSTASVNLDLRHPIDCIGTDHLSLLLHFNLTLLRINRKIRREAEPLIKKYVDKAWLGLELFSDHLTSARIKLVDGMRVPGPLRGKYMFELRDLDSRDEHVDVVRRHVGGMEHAMAKSSLLQAKSMNNRAMTQNMMVRAGKIEPRRS